MQQRARRLQSTCLSKLLCVLGTAAILALQHCDRLVNSETAFNGRRRTCKGRGTIGSAHEISGAGASRGAGPSEVSARIMCAGRRLRGPFPPFEASHLCFTVAEHNMSPFVSLSSRCLPCDGYGMEDFEHDILSTSCHLCPSAVASDQLDAT